MKLCANTLPCLSYCAVGDNMWLSGLYVEVVWHFLYGRLPKTSLHFEALFFPKILCNKQKWHGSDSLGAAVETKQSTLF